MTVPGNGLLEILLRECSRRMPEPVVVAEYARETGIDREQLEASFDYLRSLGFVSLSDWIQGRGRGFYLTPDGATVLSDQRLLDRLRLQAVYPDPLTPGRPSPRGGPTPAPAPAPAPAAEDDALRKTVLNPPTPWITYLILLTNVGVFLYGLHLAVKEKLDPLSAYLLGMSDQPQVNLLLLKIAHDSGALMPLDVLDRKEWWRLVSYAFVQGGLIGLFLNLWYLRSLGTMLESVWGRPQFLGLFLTAAVVAGCAMVWTGDLFAISAYSADCGLLAALIVWTIAHARSLPPEVTSALKRIIIGNVIMLLLLTLLFSYVGGLTPAGPIGGAVGGAAYALPCLLTLSGPAWRRALGAAVMLAVPAIAVGLIANSTEEIKQANERRLAERLVAELQRRLEQEERLRAEDKKENPHKEAFNVARSAFETYASPLLGKGRGEEFKDLPDPGFTRQGLAAFAEARAKLVKAQAVLEQGKRERTALDLTRAWIDLFDSLEGPWRRQEMTRPERDDAIAKYNRMWDLLKRWQNEQK